MWVRGGSRMHGGWVDQGRAAPCTVTLPPLTFGVMGGGEAALEGGSCQRWLVQPLNGSLKKVPEQSVAMEFNPFWAGEWETGQQPTRGG